MGNLHRYDYLLSSLPALEPIGSTPPMSKIDLLDRVAESNGPVKTVEIITLSDDLAQYEALLAEEIAPEQADLAVISISTVENAPVLPAFLLPQEQTHEHENKRVITDQLWSRYFRYASKVAKSSHSAFLKEWIGFEVGLRNALVAARAGILELDAAAYFVAPELSDNNFDFSAIISSWSAAANPLNALEVLDKARWGWLEENGGWFSSSAREIEVYAAKLVLLHHWRRILSEKQQQKVGVV